MLSEAGHARVRIAVAGSARVIERDGLAYDGERVVFTVDGELLRHAPTLDLAITLVAASTTYRWTSVTIPWRTP